MKAEIISIGTELLLGSITDTNASWLAQQLPLLGIDLFYISQVGDNLQRLSETLERAVNRSDLVICSGGLGPTEDDLTREAISQVFNETPTVVPELEATLREFFRSRGATQMPERNIKQAWLIPSARVLANPVGTAPGWWVEKEGKLLVCMPGVPHEMKTMWQNQITPQLRERLSGEVILSRTLKVLGKGESAVEEMVQDYISSTNPTLATYAKDDGIHLRITAKAADEATAEDLIFNMEFRVRERLGTLIYGEDNDTLEQILGVMLQDRSVTLAVMEAGTGGVVAARLSDAPDSPLFFRGGLISQQKNMLVEWGVTREILEENGLMSKATVEAMATAVRTKLGAEVGLAVCAVPGPNPFDDRAPGYIYMAVDLEGTVRSTETFYRTNPGEVKRLSAIFSLNMLRKALLQ